MSRKLRSHSDVAPRLRAAAVGLVLALGLCLAAPASADPHDPESSGHPLRVVAYVVHPIGVIIDTVLFRPAHWLVHRADWMQTLFGHLDEEY